MNSIKFLGTAGARFVVARQLRSSGGMWLHLNETNIMVDPGPGTLVKCATSRPKLDPSELDAIVLTHKHLDHSADINVMIESMTDGGSKHKGIVFCPDDALSNDPVILLYLRKFVECIQILREGGKYRIKDVMLNTPKRHIHDVETYGLNIKTDEVSISIISDTRYFKGLEDFYDGDILILNVARYESKSNVNHLCVADAESIIAKMRPKVAIITHFGMTMLKHKPWEVTAEIEKKLGINVIAARDGMEFKIE
jgi:phosphoribosyl 1,2-cyclic phosphodiesterase